MPITAHYAAAFYLPGSVALLALFPVVPGPAGYRAMAAVMLALVLSSCVSLYVDNRQLAKPGDAQRVAAFISSHESANEKIVVFDAQSALPLAYYYKGPNTITPMPTPMRFDRYDLNDIAIKDASQVKDVIGYRPGAHAKLWLVSPLTDNCRRTPVNLHCELLYDFVAAHYTTLIDRPFYEARVRLLSQKS